MEENAGAWAGWYAAMAYGLFAGMKGRDVWDITDCVREVWYNLFQMADDDADDYDDGRLAIGS